MIQVTTPIFELAIIILVQMQKGKKSADKLDSMNPKEAWLALVGEKEQMDEEVFSTFITETLGLAEDSVLQFYIMTTGMKTPKLGHITYQNFEHLFTHASKSKTVKDLKKVIPKMEKDLADPKVYKEMYNKVFEAFLIKNLSMDFEYAEALWEVLLRHTFKYSKEFKLYLQSLGAKKPLKCHKDLWQMMYQFAITVKDVSKDYSEADAWPVFLDNFVEFMREQKLV